MDQLTNSKVYIIGMGVILFIFAILTVWSWSQRNQALRQIEMMSTTQADLIVQRDKAQADLTALATVQAETQIKLEETKAVQAKTFAQLYEVRAALATATAGSNKKGDSSPDTVYSLQNPAPLPDIFKYARSFDTSGTGPVTVVAEDSLLFHFRPSKTVQPITFVKSLTMHVTTAQTSTTGITTLDFSIWGVEGGWGMNQGKNQIAWGENLIEIKYPDPYVGRKGDIYFGLRNYGKQAIEVENLNFTLVVQNSDGTEITYDQTH